MSEFTSELMSLCVTSSNLLEESEEEIGKIVVIFNGATFILVHQREGVYAVPCECSPLCRTMTHGGVV